MSDGTATRIDQPGLAHEAMPSLSEFAQEPGGAWPNGWYQGEIIEGYKAGGFLFETGDTLSKNGDSRNLRLCLKLTAPAAKSDGNGNSVAAGATRNTFWSQNYRVSDFHPDTLQAIKDQTAEKRTAIAIGKLGQVEKALGFGFSKHPEGHILAAPMVGQKVDVRLSINAESGYNEPTALAPAGTRTTKK